MEQLSIAKGSEAKFAGLGSKSAFLFKTCVLLRARGSPFQILAPLALNQKEPWYLVVLASGRRSKSLWCVAKFIK